MLLDNGLHSVPCDFGAIKAGLRRTPLNSHLSLDEHKRMIETIGAGILDAAPGRTRPRSGPRARSRHSGLGAGARPTC
jgi:hypothetical protein